MNTNSNLYQELSNEEIKTIMRINFQTDSLLEIKLLEGGLFNTTYKVSYGHNNHKVVLRVGPVNRNLLMRFEENLMKAEEYVYDLCNKVNIPCSKVLVCDTSKKIIDRDYMIVEYISSMPLSKCKIDEEEKGKLYSQVGGYINKLHTISNGTFGRVSCILSGEGYTTWYDYLIWEVDDIAGKLHKLGVFTEEDVENIKVVYKKNKNILDEVTTPTLLHSDLWEGNVLVDRKEDGVNVVGIIDCDRAVFGDIDFEFASGWMINDNFMRGYNQSNSTEVLGLSINKIKKKLYLIIYGLIECYVGYAQYNNKKQYEDNKVWVLNLVNELLEE